MTRAVGLPGGVDVAGVLALHPPVLVVQARLNHPVPDSLEHRPHIGTTQANKNIFQDKN